MLGFVTGRIMALNANAQSCVILAGNVGYETLVPRSLADALSVGDEMDLWLHTHVREDVIALYGFRHEPERQFFRVLLGVSGLGPKTALALLSTHGVGRLVQFILEKNFLAIAEAPGVGKKLAERIILELSTKVEKLSQLLTDPLPPSQPHGEKLRDDLNSALLNLGYPPHLVRNILDGLFARDAFKGVDFESALKQTLKEMYVQKRDA